MCRSSTRNAFTVRSVLIDNSFPSLLRFSFFAIMINPPSFLYYLFLSFFFTYFFRSSEYTRTEKKNFAKEIGRQKSETKPILKPRAFLSLRITTVNRCTTHEDVKGTRASISDESSYSSLLDYQNNFFPVFPWISFLLLSLVRSILTGWIYLWVESEILEFFNFPYVIGRIWICIFMCSWLNIAKKA